MLNITRITRTPRFNPLRITSLRVSVGTAPFVRFSSSKPPNKDLHDEARVSPTSWEEPSSDAVSEAAAAAASEFRKMHSGVVVLKESPTLEEALETARQQRRNERGFNMQFPSSAFIASGKSALFKEENSVSETILKLTDRFDRLANCNKDKFEDPDRLAMEIYGLQQEEMISLAYTQKNLHPLKNSLLTNAKNPAWQNITDEYLWQVYPKGHSFFEPPYNKEISANADDFKKFEDDVISKSEQAEMESDRKYEKFLTQHGGLRKKVGRRTKYNRLAGKEYREMKLHKKNK